MSKLIIGSICLTDLGELVRQGHSAIQKGKNGKQYVNLAIWINDKEDKYGNNVSIQLSSVKEKRESEGKVYIGNGKTLGDNKPAAATNDAEDLPF